MKADVGPSCPVQIRFSVYPLKTEHLKVLEYKLLTEESSAMP